MCESNRIELNGVGKTTFVTAARARQPARAAHRRHLTDDVALLERELFVALANKVEQSARQRRLLRVEHVRHLLLGERFANNGNVLFWKVACEKSFYFKHTCKTSAQ